jgi:hypothetical protein
VQCRRVWNGVKLQSSLLQSFFLQNQWLTRMYENTGFHQYSYLFLESTGRDRGSEGQECGSLNGLCCASQCRVQNTIFGLGYNPTQPSYPTGCPKIWPWHSPALAIWRYNFNWLQILRQVKKFTFLHNAQPPSMRFYFNTIVGCTSPSRNALICIWVYFNLTCGCANP